MNTSFQTAPRSTAPSVPGAMNKLLQIAGVSMSELKSASNFGRVGADGLTAHQRFANALKANPHLYEQYLQETGGR